jgi:lipopolysaccharide export system permease protein
VWIFLELTMLLIPSLLLLILPPALFCALLFVYHKLKTDSELVVMQSMGLSSWRLARPALYVATAVTAFAYFIALYLQPLSTQKFRDMQYFLRNNYASILLQEGVFSSPVDGLTVFIRERDSQGTLKGILVHDNRDEASAITMMAEEGKLVQTPQGPRFLLAKGNRQEMKNDKLSLLNFDSYTMDISLYDKGMSTRYTEAQELFTSELLTPEEGISEREQKKRFAEAHQRFTWPLYPLCLTLVGLSVILSGQFNRRGHWQRNMIAVLCALVIVFSAVGMRGIVANNPQLTFLLYVNVLLPIVVASWYLREREPLAAHQMIGQGV